ncbi:hypothetical protein PV416_31710 [Streptomyces ipomoeae]|jgi:3-phenylpropionate/trans-cinnamate dioxygenase ferredoxin reductase subunit|uniref:hypothetical protein n=1 Tax=Streptomyces ipomoeae TaxID=103232 RepID=UPI0029BF1F27|nr:hypothetical protein [Streptomyces ipomoeae]MDX2825519.1 hypothetical protein [Streptomyces ipomoeae]MDX2876965.1 hypothetical protein [Streptomyces ipomoeae]
MSAPGSGASGFGVAAAPGAGAPGSAPAPVVIVGAGQAGVQLADSLREAGYEGAVTLVGDEPGLPGSVRRCRRSS